MGETLLSIALVIAILGFSAIVTHLFARAMYITCPHCHTLNARRRVQCRKCGTKLRDEGMKL
jgi:ribosomal protein L40E